MVFRRVEPQLVTETDIEEWIIDARSGCSVPPEVFLGLLERFRLPLAIMTAYAIRSVLEKLDGAGPVCRNNDQG